MNSKYGGYVYMWSEETWEKKFKETFGETEDIDNFLSNFADPRIIWNAGYPMKIKDKYFEEFKEWAGKKGYSVAKPEPTFHSISYFCGPYKLSTEEVNNIEEIKFKKNEV